MTRVSRLVSMMYDVTSDGCLTPMLQYKLLLLQTSNPNTPPSPSFLPLPLHFACYHEGSGVPITF